MSKTNEALVSADHRYDEKSITGVRRSVSSSAGVTWKFRCLLPLILMTASLAVYAVLFGWWVALGVTALLYAHEMGHLIVLRARGLPASPPYFVPLLGAFITLRARPRCATEEAWIGLGGPLAGGLAAWSSAISAATIQSHLLWALAEFGFIVNLVNLVPCPPLDGGRIAAALYPGLWAIGFVSLGYVAASFSSPLLLVIGAIGMFELSERRSVADRDQNPNYFLVASKVRVAIGLSYGTLCGALLAGLIVTRGHLGG